VHLRRVDGRAGIVEDHWLKKSWLGIASEPAQRIYILRELSTENGSNDDGGGGKPDARSTSAPCNSHSSDMIGSIHMDNTRIRNPDNRNNHIGNPDSQIRFQFPQFQLKFERRNAARERKPIHLPSMQLREAFSYSFPFPVFCFARDESPCQELPRRSECAPPSII
jgi:hypothetical protein